MPPRPLPAQSVSLPHLDPRVTARALGGSTVFIASAPPPSPQPGDLWIDQANQWTLSVWAAGQWTAVPVQAGTLAGLDYTASPGGLFFYSPAVAFTTWGFEPGTQGWTGSGCTVAQSPSGAHSGDFGLQLTATSGTAWSASSPLESCSAGAVAYASAWVMAPQALAAVGLQISFYNGSGTLISTASAATAALAAGTWTQLAYSATAPAGTASAQVTVQDAESPSAGWLLYVDDVYLAGQLLTAIAPAAGTDPLGNPYVQGISTVASNGSGVRLQGSSVVLVGPGSTTNGFVSTQRNGSGASSTSQANFSGASDNDHVPQVILLGESSDATQDARVVLQVYSLSAAQAVANGVVQVGGTIAATQPGSISGAAPNGTLEGWHTITLDSGWTVASGRAAPQYRLRADGDVEFTGSATRTSFTANVALNSSNPLPAGYRPGHIHIYRPNNPVDAQAGIELDTGGVLTARASSSFAATAAEIDGTCSLL